MFNQKPMCKICDANIPTGTEVNFVDNISGHCSCSYHYVIHNYKAIYNGIIEEVGKVSHIFTLIKLWTCPNCKQSGTEMTSPCTAFYWDMSKQLTVLLPTVKVEK